MAAFFRSADRGCTGRGFIGGAAVAMLGELLEEAPALSPPRCRVAHAWIAVEVYADLQREAERRGYKTADRLLAHLVDRVVELELMGFVLA